MSSGPSFDPVIWDGSSELGFASSPDGVRRDELLTRNIAVPLIVAAQNGDLDNVVSLLSDSVNHVDATGLLGETALHMASALGYADVVDALLRAGAPVHAADKDGSTPLTHCARFCSPDRAVAIAVLLLAAGADPTRTVGVGAQRTPLEWAAIVGNASLIELLLPISPPARLLPLALASRRSDAVQLLLEKGDTPDDGDLRAALWCGSWDLFDAVYKKAALSPAAFTDFASAVLDDLLYEKINHPSFTIEDVADHFFGQYAADPNDERLASTVLASGNVELLKRGVKHGLDLQRLSAAQLDELLAEARGRKAPPAFALRVAALREGQSP